MLVILLPHRIYDRESGTKVSKVAINESHILNFLIRIPISISVSQILPVVIEDRIVLSSACCELLGL
jgi:hypothetical protein